MLRIRILALACAISLLGGGMVWALQTGGCGDDQLTCGDNEQCCEHRVATFCKDETCSSVRVEGQCIPKGNSCEEFWCGNRQCQTSWLISKDVCCVYYQPGNSPEYSCTASELSCRGNTSQLSIRPTVASSELQGN